VISWRRSADDLHAASTTSGCGSDDDLGMTDLQERDPAADHDWREAGAAWGHAAADWACLFEHYSWAVTAAIHRRADVGEGTALLDLACGSGLALSLAASAGATVHGIDAAEALVDIARDRLPGADIRTGSMFELPWRDASFDVVTSINGIWGGCHGALAEAHRVLRPGGWIGFSFWGDGWPLDLRPVFKAFARLAPPTHLRGMRRLNDIARLGVAETMLAGAGFVAIERHQRVSVIEWPDPETAWRALASVGPAVPALRHAGVAEVRQAVLGALEPCRDAHGIYRFRNDHQFVLARRATTRRTGRRPGSAR
jgi:SAM-dependent methyltransferase